MKVQILDNSFVPLNVDYSVDGLHDIEVLNIFPELIRLDLSHIQEILNHVEHHGGWVRLNFIALL